MIISAHVPIGVSLARSLMSWLPAPGYRSEADLIAQLPAFPNLALWVGGHRHLNTVKAFPCADSTQPENQFRQVLSPFLCGLSVLIRVFPMFY